jgi:WD40 repeat protein
LAASLTATGDRLATGGADHTVRVWDTLDVSARAVRAHRRCHGDLAERRRCTCRERCAGWLSTRLGNAPGSVSDGV